MGMKIGYVRVSTKEQNTARQEELMKSLGMGKVYIDKMSGGNTDRPALQEMMNSVREGDSVIVPIYSVCRFPDKKAYNSPFPHFSDYSD